MIKDLNPDVLTLDVEMPNMNGLEFLEKIMRLRPMPVVMVSTLTQRGAEVTLGGARNGRGGLFRQANGKCRHAVLQGGGASSWSRRSRRQPMRASVPASHHRRGSQKPNDATVRSGRPDGRDRLLDRRRRSAVAGPLAFSRQLSAHRDHAAHAGAFHRNIRRTDATAEQAAA